MVGCFGLKSFPSPYRPLASGISVRPSGVTFATRSNSASVNLRIYAARLSPPSCTALAVLALIPSLVTSPAWPFLKPCFFIILGVQGWQHKNDQTHHTWSQLLQRQQNTQTGLNRDFYCNDRLLLTLIWIYPMLKTLTATVMLYKFELYFTTLTLSYKPDMGFLASGAGLVEGISLAAMQDCFLCYQYQPHKPSAQWRSCS